MRRSPQLLIEPKRIARISPGMTISTDHSRPATVNGFACRNYSEVELARRTIDPANAAPGLFGRGDPQPARTSPNLLVRRMDQLSADRRSLSSHSATSAPTRSSATGTIVDRHG
jgi:hypothetical protein